MSLVLTLGRPFIVWLDHATMAWSLCVAYALFLTVIPHHPPSGASSTISHQGRPWGKVPHAPHSLAPISAWWLGLSPLSRLRDVSHQGYPLLGPSPVGAIGAGLRPTVFPRALCSIGYGKCPVGLLLALSSHTQHCLPNISPLARVTGCIPLSVTCMHACLHFVPVRWVSSTSATS